MKPPLIPPDVEGLIASRVHSVGQLLVLLRLLHEPARAWTVSSLSAEMRATEDGTQLHLDQLINHGLATRSDAGYRYATSSQLTSIVQRLSQCYEQYPVAVITLIYSKSRRDLQAFSDAFRLRVPKAAIPPSPPQRDSRSDISSGPEAREDTHDG